MKKECLFILLAVVLIVAATGCKKDVAQPISCKIKTEKESTVDSFSYAYDNHGRVILYINQDGNKSVFTYTDSTVIRDYYNGTTGLWQSQAIYHLNAQGYGNYNCEFDNSGYLVKITNGAQLTTYSYTNGNLITITYNDYNSGVHYSDNYSYYLDKIDCRDNGMSFCNGKPSNNLIKQVNDVLYNYEFDSQGRVSKQIVHYASIGITDTTIYSYY